MSESASEKQHHATAKRIEELQKQGTTLRSRDLTSLMIFIAVLVVMLLTSHKILEEFRFSIYQCLDTARDINTLELSLKKIVKSVFLGNFMLMVPVFIMALLMSFISPHLFGGWNFSLQALRFKPENLNLFVNLRNLFSLKILINLVKSLLKLFTIVLMFFLFIYVDQQKLIHIHSLSPTPAIYAMVDISKDFILLISLGLIFTVMIDLVTSYFEYNKKTMMTSQEVKEEMKETEGNVDVKRKIRGMQFAQLRQRLSVTVPTATVVITNPTHYAIAIRYDERKDRAPKVIAKGKDTVALQIRKIAITSTVPIYEAPSLARAIYHSSKLGGEINPGLYVAVALIFSYLYQLKQYQNGVAALPQQISDLKIPQELLYDD